MAQAVASSIRALGDPAQGKVTVAIGDKSVELDLAEAVKAGEKADHDQAGDPFDSVMRIVRESLTGAEAGKPLKISVKIEAKAHETNLKLEFILDLKVKPEESK